MIKKSIVLIALIPSFIHPEIRTPRGPQQPEEPIVLPAFRREQKIKKKREKKKQGGFLGWFTPKLLYSEMNFEELNQAKIERVHKEQWDVAIRYLERLIVLCQDINEKADLIIELADIQFKQGFFDDAAKQYKEFTHLYPGNKHSEYAHYRSIVCTSERTLSADRDQTKTEETIELADQFLEKNNYDKYREQVTRIRIECCKKLGHSELNIGEFYLKQGDFLAAQRRLESIRDEWIPKAPELEFRLAQLETDLAVQFPEFQLPQSSMVVAEAAQKAKPKKQNMALRF